MFNFGFLLEGGSSSWLPVIMIVLFIFILYFLMIRPQKKQERKDAEMRDALQVGDEVTTIGGIIGKVISIKGETFVLETTKAKTKIRFLKGAIRSVDVKAADIASQIIETKAAESSGDTATKADADIQNEATNEAAQSAAEITTEETAEENKQQS